MEGREQFESFFEESPVTVQTTRTRGRRSSLVLTQQLEADVGFDEDDMMMMVEMPAEEEGSDALAGMSGLMMALPTMDDAPSSSAEAATLLRDALAKVDIVALPSVLRAVAADGGATVTFEAMCKALLDAAATPAAPFTSPTWSVAVDALLGHLKPPSIAPNGIAVHAAVAAVAAISVGSADDVCAALFDAGGDADGVALSDMITALELREATLVRCAAAAAAAAAPPPSLRHTPRAIAEHAFADAGVLSVPGCEEPMPIAAFRLWYRAYVRTPERRAALEAVRPRLRLCKLEHVLSAMQSEVEEEGVALNRAQFRRGFLQSLIYPPGDATGIMAADELFDAFDTDGSAGVDLVEMISGIAAFTGDSSGELLETIFAVFDGDGNGTLSEEEMRTFVRSTLLVASLRAPAADSAAEESAGGKKKKGGKSSITSKTRGMNIDRTARAVAKRAFAAADADGSGSIDFDEFTAWYNKTMGKKQ
jgi:Ca2+-binding EF-hand superfamily protein